MTRYLLVGTTTGPVAGEQVEGILVYQMNLETGALTQVHSVKSGQNPSFLARHPNGRFVYCVNEGQDGGASAYSIQPDGNLMFLNQVKVGGDDPCYASVDTSGGWLLTANYSSGSLTVLPIQADGRLGERTQRIIHEGASTDPRRRIAAYDDTRGPIIIKVMGGTGALPGANPERQDAPHAHSILFAPGGRFTLAADLGMDRVWVYQFEKGRLAAPSTGNRQTSLGRMDQPSTARPGPIEHEPASGHNLKAGSGPRHTAFHPNGKFVYVSNELSNTAVACAWNGDDALLMPIQEVSTLPEGFKDENYVAHIALRPDGKYAYISNRGHDSIAIFSVDGTNGRLTPAGHVSTQGHWPRNFCIDPEGRFLIAANQESDSLVVYRIDETTGGLDPVGQETGPRGPFFVMTLDL
jgi:6-phosphogluconolactonase